MTKIKTYGNLTKDQQKLVIDHQWIPGRLAYRAMNLTRGFTGAMTRKDLEQIANFALCVAARKFDTSKKVKFSTYAWTYANGYISHALRDKSRMVRLPRWVPSTRDAIKELKDQGKSYEEIQDILEIDASKLYDCVMSYGEIHLPLDYEDDNDDRSYAIHAVYEQPYASSDYQDVSDSLEIASKYSSAQLSAATAYIEAVDRGEQPEPNPKVIAVIYDVMKGDEVQLW